LLRDILNALWESLFLLDIGILEWNIANGR